MGFCGILVLVFCNFIFKAKAPLLMRITALQKNEVLLCVLSVCVGGWVPCRLSGVGQVGVITVLWLYHCYPIQPSSVVCPSWNDFCFSSHASFLPALKKGSFQILLV